jgi:hypothetical protein
MVEVTLRRGPRINNLIDRHRSPLINWLEALVLVDDYKDQMHI